MDALANLGALLAILCVASPLHKKLRQLSRGYLVGLTIKQLPWVAATQTYSNKVLDVAVLLSAATITLEAYLTLIPVLIWSGKEHMVVTGLLPQLALAGYVVFAIKDILESPRPGDCLKAAPDVHITVRDPSGDIEDGVPSAHCCGAVSLLLYGLHTAAAAGVLTAQQKALGQVAAAAWVLWLAWGRAYLGLHTPLDLATGSLLGGILVRLWVHVEPTYAAWLESAVQQPPWQLPLYLLLVSAVLMRCYPMASRWTSCYSYATAWAAGWAGATLGWGLLQQGHLGGHAASTAGSSEWMFGGLVPPIACKAFLGLGLVAATKVVAKAMLLVAFRPLFACVPVPVRCLWQPPVAGAAPDATAVRDTDTKRSKLCTAPPAGGSVLKAEVQAALTTKATGGKCDSRKASAGIWSLRYTHDGVGNDVVAAARWCSYLAVGFMVMAWHAMWPSVQHTLAPVVAAA